MKSRLLENGNLEITVKYVIRGISGRKRIIASGERLNDTDSLVLQVARAFRWQKYIDEGRFANTVDLAQALGVEPSVVARTIRLTLLSPKIIHRIIAGEIPNTLTLAALRSAIPDLWSCQEEKFLGGK